MGQQNKQQQQGEKKVKGLTKKRGRKDAMLAQMQTAKNSRRRADTMARRSNAKWSKVAGWYTANTGRLADGWMTIAEMRDDVRKARSPVIMRKQHVRRDERPKREVATLQQRLEWLARRFNGVK